MSTFNVLKKKKTKFGQSINSCEFRKLHVFNTFSPQINLKEIMLIALPISQISQSAKCLVNLQIGRQSPD
jgi:hypothetical protein